VGVWWEGFVKVVAFESRVRVKEFKLIWMMREVNLRRQLK